MNKAVPRGRLLRSQVGFHSDALVLIAVNLPRPHPQQLALDQIQRLCIASARRRDRVKNPMPSRMIIRDQAPLHMRNCQRMRIDRPVRRPADSLIAHSDQALVDRDIMHLAEIGILAR